MQLPRLLQVCMHRSLCMLLFLASQTSSALITASPRGDRKLTCARVVSKPDSHYFWLYVMASAHVAAATTRMEIHEQDFSFRDGTRERPLIEVVTKDVKTADIFNIVQVLGMEEDATTDEETWKEDGGIEEFTRQDVLVLILITLLVLRLIVHVVQVLLKLVMLPLRWLETHTDEKFEIKCSDKCHDQVTVKAKKRLAVVRFCYLQFSLIIDKLKREMRENKKDDIQQMIASLPLFQQKQGKEILLTEILAIVRTIQVENNNIQASEVDDHVADTKQDVTGIKDIDLALPEAWTRLQEIYSSFLRIHQAIIRRQKSRRVWQSNHQRLEGKECRSRLSSEDVHDELQQLQELTRELPLGFTADMFKSLGNVMHEKMVADESENNVALSLQPEIKVPCATIPVHGDKKYNTTAQQAA